MPLRQVARSFSSSVVCDGADTIISVSSVSAQNSLTTVSLAVWINPRSNGESSSGRIFGKASGLTNRWRMGMNSNQAIQLSAQWTSSGAWVTTSTIPFRKWTHVVMTYDMSSTANNAVFYINGVLAASSTSSVPTGSLAADNSNLYIGNASTTDRTFDGSVAEVQFYNKILSAAEVAEIYYGQVSTVSGCVGYWKLNEGTGTTATDTTGNADGTITTGAWSSATPISTRSTAGARLPATA